MRFKFNKHLEYQLDAINSVVDIFDTGRNIIQTNNDFKFEYSISNIIQNKLEVDHNKILRNLQAIQVNNNIEPVESLDSLDFSVEMETGTGKTYVYLRTILELNKKYRLSKFIILVPSVAIREGVLKTLEQTRSHFYDSYTVNPDYFAYDSDKLSRVRDFVQSDHVSIMIMTIQSFNKDTTVMRQTDRDNTYGEESYLSMVAQTKPVVIMDEPQNMESDLAKSSIGDLKPLFKLRYSATHKEVHNLVYRLTPVDAYRKGLVKEISVWGVKDGTAGSFIFRVNEIETKKGEDPKARVVIEVKNTSGEYLEKEVVLRSGDNLFLKSKRNDLYKDIIVQNIDARYQRVELSDGVFHNVDAASDNKEEIFRTQIRETIKEHGMKQEELSERIKVLSLFFIDKVDNYVPEDGLIKKIFIEEFLKLKNNFDCFKDVDVDTIHTGYFASKKSKGLIEYKDSTNGRSKADKEVYDLIMKKKERLLSFNEPVSFIFSHSALKEGWDNPNVFQICTLSETKSVMKKRQEIGRGLRLPVDINGDRVENKEINVLTVIANSSYDEYASGLQQEFSDAGYSGVASVMNAKEKKITVKTTKHLDSEDFKELWKRISKRTKFSLEVLSNKIVEKSVEKIDELSIRSMSVTVEKGQIYFDEKGHINSVREATSSGYRVKRKLDIPHIVERVARETGLTKQTILSIVSSVDNLDLLIENPEEYTRSVILIVRSELNNLLINEGLRYEPTGELWEVKLLFSDFDALPSRVIPSERSVFDKVVFDSVGEKEFALKLERDRRVRVYTKLPRGFIVDTPLGHYVPDWAIVLKTDKEEKLYLVRETKFEYTDLEKDLTWDERQKIACAKKHFKAIDVDFKVSESKDLMDLLS